MAAAGARFVAGGLGLGVGRLPACMAAVQILPDPVSAHPDVCNTCVVPAPVPRHQDETPEARAEREEEERLRKVMLWQSCYVRARCAGRLHQSPGLPPRDAVPVLPVLIANPKNSILNPKQVIAEEERLRKEAEAAEAAEARKRAEEEERRRKEEEDKDPVKVRRRAFLCVCIPVNRRRRAAGNRCRAGRAALKPPPLVRLAAC